MADRSHQVPHQVDAHPSRTPPLQRDPGIERRCIGRVEHWRSIPNPDDDLRPISIDLDLDRAAGATITVPDHVRHPFVHGLDEVAHGVVVRVEPLGGDADECPHLRQTCEIGIQAQGGRGCIRPGHAVIPLRHTDPR